AIARADPPARPNQGYVDLTEIEVTQKDFKRFKVTEHTELDPDDPPIPPSENTIMRVMGTSHPEITENDIMNVK
ncbi:hypothetical protein FRC07_013419, partial [Ceratobasidium sp. 392]